MQQVLELKNGAKIRMLQKLDGCSKSLRQLVFASIKIKRCDREKADAILLKHWEDGDIDANSVGEINGSDYLNTTTYWLHLYCSEDLDIIINEFRENGIEVL